MRFRMLWCALLAAVAALAVGPFPEMGPPSVGIVVTWDQSPPKSFLRLWQSEVESIFRPAGLSLHWEMGPRAARTGTYDRIVIVKLKGLCSSERVRELRGDFLPGEARLGWTYVVDGDVIPHSVVDCNQITRAVAEIRGHLSHPLYLHAFYHRLAGRVLVHEMMHALLETAEHDTADFTRSPLQVTDLQTAPRLRPSQIVALQRIGRAKAGVSVARGVGQAAP